MIWLHLCTSYSSSCHHSPPPLSLSATKSRMETFLYLLTQVHLETSVKTARERHARIRRDVIKPGGSRSSLERPQERVGMSISGCTANSEDVRRWNITTWSLTAWPNNPNWRLSYVDDAVQARCCNTQSQDEVVPLDWELLQGAPKMLLHNISCW